MRPVRLELNGFAAFRDGAVVDFTDADFFVLVGATGSGKSTVIDALTFALYGTVPRWNHRSMVMYGLAPTANQGKVALVFDVGEQRYVVARELRRAKSGGVTVRNARLDRLIDPTASGELDDDTESLATDSGVSAAVEKLLGLPYEHFCQCVVLPQGEFADFLRAKPADRRTILLRLLGAGLYSDIGQRANNRAREAEVRADLLAGQAAGLADATEQAEEQAAQRESVLAGLSARVRLEVPRLRSAARALETAQDDLDRIVAERDALAGIAVPAQIPGLDADHSAATGALDAAGAAEAQARRADRAARDRLAAGPDRGPLDQALRDHAELGRVGAALPDARAAVSVAVDRLTGSVAEAGRASEALDRARSAREVARGTVIELTGQLQQLTAAIELLDAVALPDGLMELTGRTTSAQHRLTAAAAALAAAQDREAAAQDAAAAAPARGPLEESLRLVRQLADAERAVVPLEEQHHAAAEALEAATTAATEAERKRDDSRLALEHASLTHRAEALRSDLIAGQACPVCDQVVATLPAAVDLPELATAERAMRDRDRRLTSARKTEASVSADETKAATRLADARQQIAAFIEQLAGRPRDLDALHRTLAEIDALDAAQRAATAATRTRRAEHDRAVADARKLDTEVASARTGLRGARDRLVPVGAPALEESDLLAAWTGLAEWAARAAAGLRANQLGQRVALAAAEDTNAKARDAFVAADDRNNATQAAVNAATATAERAKAEADRLRIRMDELAAALAHAPDVETATAQLRRIDEMTAAVVDSDRMLAAAAAGRATAAAALDDLSDRVGQAWRGLRATRDAVTGFGAPDLSEGSLLVGWTTLAAWASAAGRARSAAVPDAQDAVTAATRRRDQTAKHLTDEFAALGVRVGDDLGGGPAGDLADSAPAAAATAFAEAQGAHRRITERRAQAASVGADLAKAQEAQQVGRMLGNLLRSNNFPEWLESAALDTLVIDASRRLAELSGGQFELTHRDGEFMVVDHADADSIRSVRTLSGGETFQASLALALALSTQLSSMAAAGAARLDSIFLDEGFGTLDDATLDVVAATLENLAQGDRMVGVVTHVGALADRIPVRFRVRRDSRTSSIERESP